MNRDKLCMMRVSVALLAVAGLVGCGGMPTGGTNPTDSASVVGTCNTSYYNSDFRFGFDLPLTAIFRHQGSEPTLLFDASWLLASSVAALSADVGEFPASIAGLDDEAMLLGFATTRYDGFAASPNTEFLMDTSGTLSNGDLAYMVVIVTDVACICDADDRSVVYEVMTVKDNRIYRLAANTQESLWTDTVHIVLSDIMLSFCVD